MKIKVNKIRIIINCVVFGLSFIFLYYSIINKWEINPNLLYWTFSTVPQVFGALLALSATIIFLNNQKLNDDFNRTCERIREIVIDFKGNYAWAFSNKHIFEAVKEISNETHKGNEDKLNLIIRALINFDSIKNERKRNSRYLNSFMFEMMLAIGFSLLFLPLTEVLTNKYAGIWAIAIVLYLSIASFFNFLFGLLKRIS